MPDWRAMRVGLRQLALVCALAFGTACASKRERGPEGALAAYAAALARGDLETAYAHLSRGLRAELSRAEFERQVRDNPEELAALLAALAQPGPVRVRAQLTLGDGTRVELEQEAKGAFRLTRALTDFYPQDTPRAALESFVRAVEHERWDVLVALMPDADRRDLDAETLGDRLLAEREELTRLVALLKSSLDSPIEIVGDRAVMPYGESFTARLVLENARWKVEDPS